MEISEDELRAKRKKHIQEAQDYMNSFVSEPKGKMGSKSVTKLDSDAFKHYKNLFKFL